MPEVTQTEFPPAGLDLPDTTANPRPGGFDRRRLKVLHVVNGQFYAGAERVQDLLALHLPESQVDNLFVCVKADRFPSARQADEVPLWNVNVRHPWHRAAFLQIGAIAAGEGCHILHSHTPRSCWPAASVAKRLGLVWIHTLHDLFLERREWFVRQWLNRYTIRCLRAADGVIAVSPAALDLADRLSLGRRRWMIRNGVPGLESLASRPLPDHWTLGTVSLFRPCKGLDVLLRAVARLRLAGHPVQLRAVGPFETAAYEGQIKNLVQELNIQSFVQFTGFCRDVAAELQRMDLFVLPSVGPEGLPMVVLEAMAQGVPVIGSRVAGIRDIIQDGLDGRLVNPSDPDDLAHAVQQFVDGRLDWMSARRAAFEHHRQQFSAARMAAETAAVYRQCCPAVVTQLSDRTAP